MNPAARLRHPSPAVLDAGLAVLTFVVMAGTALLSARQAGEPRETVWGLALLAVEAGAVFYRRRATMCALVVGGGAAAVYGISELPDPITHLGLLILFGTYVSLASPSRAVLAVAVMPLIVLSVVLARDSDALDFVGAIVFATGAAVLGELSRARREQLQAAQDRLDHAVTDERTRIARELHDVVAHHVSMMVVQAEAAAVTAPNPDAFDGIARTGREALTELRRLVTVLRDADDVAPSAPQPGIADLGLLSEQVRAAGVAVDLHVVGEPRSLPPGVDLTVYRIVQEALTNTMKHAGPARAEVSLRWHPDAIEICVRDDGNGAAAKPSPRGHGLVGIDERVALFGGTARAGPAPDGGFLVTARLPTGVS
jgi:signal transduction histidine kinase